MSETVAVLRGEAGFPDAAHTPHRLRDRLHSAAVARVLEPKLQPLQHVCPASEVQVSRRDGAGEYLSGRQRLLQNLVRYTRVQNRLSKPERFW